MEACYKVSWTGRSCGEVVFNHHGANFAVSITRVKKNHLIAGSYIYKMIVNNIDIIHVVVKERIVNANIIGRRGCMDCKKVIISNC